MELQMLAPGSYAWTSDADPIRYYRLPLVGRPFRNRITRTVALLPAGDRVLEIGYGSGVSFLNLAQKFREIYGLDLHDRADDVAESLAGKNLKLNLKQGSIVNLPYGSESFDAVVAISIHEELPPDQQETAFAEVRRVLRPGGCYVVGVPGVNFMMNTALRLLGCPIGRYHVTTERMILKLMRNRFDVDATVYAPKWWPKSLTTYVSIRGWKR